VFGMEKILIVAVVAFLFFGPDKLPELARTLGKFMREFRKVQDEMETTIRSEMYKVDLGTTSPETVAAITSAAPGTAEEADGLKESVVLGESTGWAEEHEEESEE
jgi:TatA/E family protein of Tat protein translocase